MAKKHPTLYLHICTHCNRQRTTTKKYVASGLCRRCAYTGTLTVLERFWQYVNKDTACPCHSWEDRCWIWTAQCDKKTGYGSFSYKQRPIAAHRFLYQAEHGQLPSTIYVLHQPPCILRNCVRHLYAGSPKQNTQDAISMQRFPIGDNHWTRKTPEKMLRGEAHKKSRNDYQALPRGEEHARAHNHYQNFTRGERHHMTSLTTSQILALRADRAAGMTLPAIVQKYGISKSAAHSICTKKTWKHI